MSGQPRIAMGLALTLLAASAVQAHAGFSGWGSAHYEKPAPTPEVTPAAPTPVATAAAAPRIKAHERAALTRHRSAPKKLAAHDAPPAPTPATEVKVASAAGPVEAAAPTIRDLVSKHARANGVPESLAAAVVTIESRFNPNARGGSALGLMQIKYQTARSMGYAGGVTALFAPETNLHFGMRVLADAYKASNGDVCMTLARYQSGHRVNHVSAANRAYCTRARALMARAS